MNVKSYNNPHAVALAGLLLAIITFAVFLPCLDHEFIHYDDDVYITANPQVQAGLTLEGLKWAFTTTLSAHWHPLTWLSHMLDCELFGLNPRWHHLTNLLFHLANTLLIFFLLNRMTEAFWRSLFVAALFALHPLHAEPVAWVADRKDLLSTFFFMLTLWAYHHYVESPGTGRYLLIFLFFALGLLAKSMIITLPLLLLLLDYWPLGRYKDFGFRDYRRTATIILEKLPLFGLAAASSVVTMLVMKRGVLEVSAKVVGFIPSTFRLGNALLSYAHYLKKTIWPLDLAVIYPHPETLSPWQVVGAGCLLATLTVLAFRMTRPYLKVGWLWFVVALAPVIGFIKAGPWSPADRYAYIPLIGLFIIMGWGLSDILKRRWNHRLPMPAVTGLLLLFFIPLTWAQLKTWRNSQSLFQHAIDVTSKNYKAHNNLGNALALQGKIEIAIHHFREALEIRPDYVEARNNLGLILANLGQFDEAMFHYNEALKINPDHASVYNNLGNALAWQGRLEKAVQHFEKAVRIDPEYAEAYNNLGNTLARRGRFDEAIASFEKTLSIKPDLAEVHKNLGNAFLLKGELERGINRFKKAVALKPDFAEAHYFLGEAYVKKEVFEKAMRHYNKALQIRPDFGEAHFKMGKVLALLGRMQDAVYHFVRALRDRPNYAEARFSLGLAFVALDRPELALQQYRVLTGLNPQLAKLLLKEIQVP